MDEVAQVREKLDIVSFISDYLSLKKAGRNFKTNCPFHNEKTPSFVISPERQIWHCFGCGKGGDAFTFIMEYEHMEFGEALRFLANKVGIELKEEFKKGTYSKKDKIYKINDQAAKFYSYILLNHPSAKKALIYLIDDRKINKEMISHYKIGYAPSFGTALSNYLLKKKGWQKNELLEAGISFIRRGDAYDFFKGRIIFPLTDHHGNIVAFSGRVLDSKEMPKYINTRDTLVYHKGSHFFGLEYAKDEIKEKEQAIVVEGEFDAISCYKEGIKNVVALKGTALTENQANLLSRFAKKITLCLDKDNAGFEAIKRSLAVLEKKDLTTSVVVAEEGKDPDESIKKDAASFKKALRNDIPVYDFLIDETLKKHKSTDALGKKKIASELLPFFAQIENEVLKEHYLKLLSQKIETSYDSIVKEIEKIKSGRKADQVVYPTKTKRERREVLEEYLLALIIQSETPFEEIQKALKVMKGYKFFVQSIEKVLKQLEEELTVNKEMDMKNFATKLPKEIVKTFDASYLLPISKFNLCTEHTAELEKTANDLMILFAKERINLLKNKLKESDVDSDKVNQEIADLIVLLKRASI